jgi:hypothetical protein
MMNEFTCAVCAAVFSMDMRYGMVSTCTECGSEETDLLPSGVSCRVPAQRLWDGHTWGVVLRRRAI